MITTYLKTKDKAAFDSMTFDNVMQPQRGRPASTYTDENGVVTDIAAAGDPDYLYTSVLSFSAIQVPLGVEICDEETGKAVCGVWA